MNVPFYRHSLDASYASRVAKVLDTPFLTSAGVGKEVEAQLAQFFGVPHAALVNSWTNGAVAVLLALGVGRDHEVIVPAMTFIASANVVELVGARPVFVDVDPKTLLMTSDGVRAALTPATRAVIPVHLYGQMCDMLGLRRALADRPDVALIEDCAHCFEGTRDGEGPGLHSDAAIFSFYATKNVTCGEGGTIVTRRADLHELVLQTRLHGMSAGAADRFRNQLYRHWDMARLGTKANLPDLLAILLPPQIETIRERLPQREELAQRYEQALAGTPIRIPGSVPGAVHARHLFPIHVDPRQRDETLVTLNQAGIGATVNYNSVPTLTYYRNRYGYTPADFPVSQSWGEGTLSLPFFPGITTAEQERVIDVLREAVIPRLQTLDQRS